VDTPGGYVRIYRKLPENPVWTQLSPAVLKVMIAFLLKANWKQATWYDGATEVQIPRGSFVTSYATMALFCGLSIKQIRGAFEHLERAQFAAYTRAQRWTMVTVLNYGAYQDSEDQGGTAEGTSEGSKRARRRAPIEEEKNINTPPPPSSAWDGAGAPLELVPPDSNEETPRPAANRKPNREALEQVAKSIHGRHPAAYGRRDLGVGGVEKKLAAILKHKRIPAAEVDRYLRRIDRNHATACESEAWRKDGGQFVKSLRNYLAPAEERYDLELTAAPRKEPARLMA
jgi:hypothetical protein